MEGPLVRGYWLIAALAVLERRYGLEARERARGALPGGMQGADGPVLPGAWCPRAGLTTALRTVVQAAGADPGEALAACGREAAASAFDTSLKWVIGLMSPAMFLAKVPQLWQVDSRGSGVVEADADLGRLRATGVSGFEYFGPAYAGWLEEGLRRAGAPGKRVVLDGWSWTDPAPDTIVWVLQ